MELQEINEFATDKHFLEIKHFVNGLVRAGKLTECGLDPTDAWHYVEVFKTIDGTEWHMAVPDHAFRGYLKKAH